MVLQAAPPALPQFQTDAHLGFQVSPRLCQARLAVRASRALLGDLQ